MISSFQPLYKANGKEIFSSDIIAALGKVGIKNGDTIFVHSDVSVFGKLAFPLGRELLLGALVEVLKRAVGREGTLIMPTFTYSFCKGEIYDIDKSRSTVGALTEFFRNQSGVKRNFQPIFSVAAWGKNKANYLKTGKDSSGKDSIFDKLLKGKGKIVFFGASFQSCTFLHFVEQTQGVPYRHLKTFRGWIKNKQEKYRDECVFLVRNLNQEIIKDTSKLERHLNRKKLIKRVGLGTGEILAVNVTDLFREATRMLKRNAYYFLKGKPNEK